jgi:tRNA G10  N-methylase Trm11
MKYIFILGRNPNLSIEEIFSFLRRYSIKALKNLKKENALFLETNTSLPERAIDLLGGTIAIGEVLCSGKNIEILRCLDKKTLYSGTENKLNYAIWEFSENAEEILEYLKKRFREEKLKATRKQLSGTLEMQGGDKKSFLSSKLIKEQYIIFEEKEENYFARVIGMSDYEEIERRDMEKPFRRGKLSISPRLAKIMINLSEVKKGETLLDPFCGIGAVLQEALLQEIKVIGIDIDTEAIGGAKKNLEWKKFNKKDYQIISGDSRKKKNISARVIATEPDLGEKLRVAHEKGDKIIIRKTYSFKRAKERMEKFEKLMVGVLNNLKNSIRGRIVFTAPFIKTFDKKKNRIGCNIENILERTNLRLLRGFPIEDFREGQITGRQIFVLEE